MGNRPYTDFPVLNRQVSPATIFYPHRNTSLPVSRESVTAPRFPARILIVDDHPVTRTAIRTLLHGHPLHVCGEAKNGKEALEKVVELKPEIVLLDIHMPVMDGIAAAIEIRRIHPAGKIVFLSLYENPGAAARPLAHAFVSKSEAGTQLIPTLTRLIDGTDGNLRYAWQHLVAKAFEEPIPKYLPKRINLAERAISARLIESDLIPKEERIALKEALQALRKLLPARQKLGPGKKAEIA